MTGGTLTFASSASPSPEVLLNFSGTHSTTCRVHRPETESEVLALLVNASKEGRHLRAVGTCLSPNGVALPGEGADAVSLAGMDKVLGIDREKQRITVQAGCSVRQVLDALGETGLTLSNFSSIVEQEIAGWTQVAAHGTGATLPTVEEQIVSLKVATPSGKILSLSEGDPLFPIAKANLGTLGVITELTLDCCLQHNLLETVTVESHEALWNAHAERLRAFRHVKYMFIPSEKHAIVVTAEPTAVPPTILCEEKERKALEVFVAANGKAIPGATFSTYRGELLRQGWLGGLTAEKVKDLNAVELEFWKRAQGSRVAPSTEVLGFDCGGQQWVFETCLPNGTINAPLGADRKYLEALMKGVDEAKFPLPSPIEVRYTAASSAPLSPAYSKKEGDIFAWIGVVMYMPEGMREEVTKQFSWLRANQLDTMSQFGAVPHWAKAELENKDILALMAGKYKTVLLELQEARKTTDPKGVLSSALLDDITKLV